MLAYVGGHKDILRTMSALFRPAEGSCVILVSTGATMGHFSRSCGLANDKGRMDIIADVPKDGGTGERVDIALLHVSSFRPPASV